MISFLFAIAGLLAVFAGNIPIGMMCGVLSLLFIGTSTLRITTGTTRITIH